MMVLSGVKSYLEWRYPFKLGSEGVLNITIKHKKQDKLFKEAKFLTKKERDKLTLSFRHDLMPNFLWAQGSNGAIDRQKNKLTIRQSEERRRREILQYKL